VVNYVFFAHTKHSIHFIKLRWNHWSHMDYFNQWCDIFTFLGIEGGSCIGCQWRPALLFWD